MAEKAVGCSRMWWWNYRERALKCREKTWHIKAKQNGWETLRWSDREMHVVGGRKDKDRGKGWCAGYLAPLPSAEACRRERIIMKTSTVGEHTQSGTCTLTLALKGLQQCGIRGAEPRGVAAQDPLQAVSGVTEEHIRCTIAYRAEQSEALGRIAKHILQQVKCGTRTQCMRSARMCVSVLCICVFVAKGSELSVTTHT